LRERLRSNLAPTSCTTLQTATFVGLEMSNAACPIRPAAGRFAFVYLAGLRLPDEDVRELIMLVDEPPRSFLEKALGLNGEVVALTNRRS